MAEPRGLESAVLRPGDMLYLPAGAWHSTDAVGESLSLTLRIFDSAPANVARACLEQLLRSEGAWRRPLPIVSHAETPDGGTHESMCRVLAERLAALQAFVAALSVSDMHRIWEDARATLEELVARGIVRVIAQELH